MRKRSTQYPIKWVASFRMEKNVINRGKLKSKGGEPIGLNRGRRMKGKKGSNRDGGAQISTKEGGHPNSPPSERTLQVIRHGYWGGREIGPFVIQC